MGLGFESGALIGDRFRLETKIGEGGIGAVFRAIDLVSSDAVAVKLIRAPRGDVAWQRFIAEATALSRVRDSTIVGYRGHGECGAGQLYLAMELLSGCDLAEFLREEGIRPTAVLPLLGRVLHALSVLHAAGIVHRDIKPHNIFLPDRRVEEAKLIDLGIATAAESFDALAPVEEGGNAIGTPGYMAPEQIRGLGVDARADVFSLGAVAFECFAGRRPFVGENVMCIMAKVLYQDAPRLRGSRPDLPLELDEIVARMLARDVDQRLSSAEEVARALASLPQLSDTFLPLSPRGLGMITQLEQQIVTIVGMIPSARQSLIDGIDPDRLVSELRQHLQPMADACGVDLEILGNGAALAVSAQASSPEEQAIRAARFALRVRDCIEGRVAVATGRSVLIGDAPVGDAVKRATEGLSDAPIDRVVVDAYTTSLLGGRFQSAWVGDYRVLEQEARPTMFPGTSDREEESRCLGRRREMGLLRATLDETMEEQAARALLITGSAGIGKSLVMHEFARDVRDEDPAPRVFVGRGDPMSAGVPFFLLGTCIERAADIRPVDEVEVRREKLAHRLSEVFAPKEVDTVAPWIGRFLRLRQAGEEEDVLHNPQVLGDRMRAVFLAWMQRELKRGPVLVVLDDLQWADPASLKTLDLCLNKLGTLPLLIVAAGRPEVRHRFPNLWSQRNVSDLSLDPLSPRVLGQIAARCGPELSESRLSEIAERADGNPFFAEELVCALRASPDQALPDSITATMMTRLHGLGAEERRVLRAGSVFGTRFSESGISALFGQDAASVNLPELLSRLVDSNILERDSADGHSFAFAQGLVRDACYRSLTEADRPNGHRLAAEFLVDQPGVPALLLAEHFDIGEEANAAVHWFCRAAQDCLAADDLRGVIATADRALGLGIRNRDAALVLAIAAEAQIWKGDAVPALRSAKEASRELEAGSVEWIYATSVRIDAQAVLGDAADLEETVDALLAHPTPERHSAWIGCLAQVGASLVLLGRSDLASRVIEAAENRCVDSRCSESLVLGRIHHARGHRAVVGGNVVEAVEEYRKGAHHFEAAKAHRLASGENANLGGQLLELGALEAARETLVKALADGERIGSEYCVAFARVNLGRAQSALGEIEAALESETTAAAELRTLGDRRLEGAARVTLAELFAAQANLEQAREEWGRARELVSELPPSLAVVYAVAARIALDAGDLDEAEELCRNAEALRDESGMEERQLYLRVVAAELQRAAGDLVAARTTVDEAWKDLHRQATTIDDDTLRRSFLERVPEHRRLAELFKDLGD